MPVLLLVLLLCCLALVTALPTYTLCNYPTLSTYLLVPLASTPYCPSPFALLCLVFALLCAYLVACLHTSVPCSPHLVGCVGDLVVAYLSLYLTCWCIWLTSSAALVLLCFCAWHLVLRYAHIAVGTLSSVPCSAYFFCYLLALPICTPTPFFTFWCSCLPLATTLALLCFCVWPQAFLVPILQL